VLIFFIFVDIFGFGQILKAAEPANNLGKAAANVLTGWTEVAIYPVQEAAKPGWLGKILFPLNIGVGGIKAAVREGVGAIDLVTFFKGDNIINSYPGEEF